MQTVSIQKHITVILHGLYLINLLALPGIALIPMAYLCKKYWYSQDLLTVCHVRQVVASTIWFFLVFFGGVLIFWLLGDNSPEHWTMLLMYLIVFHTTFVMVGMIGLAKAITGKPYRPYLIGVPYQVGTGEHLDA
ncbi:hypothetical protein [Motiliproteus sp. MSK22-1]|uniref:hypothetical protein n=1 Tax=Motiliproteus sp. MSK22-1 TaxID=1897630 RepID=UPI00117CAED8|nr:hypothetical protein [Motiliproteus sp. MSK22-1]